MGIAQRMGNVLFDVDARHPRATVRYFQKKPKRRHRRTRQSHALGFVGVLVLSLVVGAAVGAAVGASVALIEFETALFQTEQEDLPYLPKLSPDARGQLW